LAAQRQTEKSCTLEEMIKVNQRREQKLWSNFQKLYQVDIHDERYFDLVLDTTFLKPEEAFQKICQFIDQFSFQ